MSDVEMVDEVLTPENEVGDDLSAATRVDELCSLDERIVSILEKGSKIVESISAGKLPKDAERKREEFKTAINEYNKLVEEVNSSLRNEVRLLHEASMSKLLPLHIPVLASSLGREKEEILLKSFEEKNSLPQ